MAVPPLLLTTTAGAVARPVKPAAKNVIIMISDGWSYRHLQSESYYRYGKEARQIYNRFPVEYAVSTYEAYQPGDPCHGWGYDPVLAWSDFDYVMNCYTDSAAAATALATGIKTYDGGIGKDLDGHDLVSIVEYAEDLGKATGVVSTVQFAHATPAGFVAHNVSRDNYLQISDSMINSSAVDVIMGGGHPWYDASGRPIGTPNTFNYVGGAATWAALEAGTAGADADGDGVADPWTLIETRAEFQALGRGAAPARVIGVPQVYKTLQEERGGDVYADPFVVPLTPTVPTLAEMALGAINVLDGDADGFVLVIEGGAVDWAAHDNESGRLIEEAMAFEDAVNAVHDWVQANSNWGETLLIVTADHETGYLNGPGSNPDWLPIINNGAGVLPGMAWYSGEHTNSLVPLSAKGDAARLFHHRNAGIDPVRGPYIDNTDIAEVMFEALTPR